MNGITGIQSGDFWRSTASRIAEAKEEKYAKLQEEAENEVTSLDESETETETTGASLFDSVANEMSEEDKEKLEQLKNELAMILAKGDEATAQDRKRVKEIAEEIEDLTGMEGLTQVDLSDALEKLDKTDGKEKDEEDKEEEVDSQRHERSQFSIEMQMRGMALPEMELEKGPGMMSYLKEAAKLAYENAASLL